MRCRRIVLCTLLGGAFAAGSLAVSSPAWGADDMSRGCRLYADPPEKDGSRVRGEGGRDGCSDTVTYLWVRIYRAIDHWPDSEIAVNGRQYVQNAELTPAGPCEGPHSYYTHTSTATGLSGDTVESRRAKLC